MNVFQNFNKRNEPLRVFLLICFIQYCDVYYRLYYTAMHCIVGPGPEISINLYFCLFWCVENKQLMK